PLLYALKQSICTEWPLGAPYRGDMHTHWCLWAEQLDQGCGALPPGAAHRDDAELGIRSFQLVEESAEEARPGAPERVVGGDGASRNVDPVRLHVEFAHPGQGHRGEGLVDLVSADVRLPQAVAIE